MDGGQDISQLHPFCKGCCSGGNDPPWAISCARTVSNLEMLHGFSSFMDAKDANHPCCSQKHCVCNGETAGGTQHHEYMAISQQPSKAGLISQISSRTKLRLWCLPANLPTSGLRGAKSVCALCFLHGESSPQWRIHASDSCCHPCHINTFFTAAILTWHIFAQGEKSSAGGEGSAPKSFPMPQDSCTKEVSHNKGHKLCRNYGFGAQCTLTAHLPDINLPSRHLISHMVNIYIRKEVYNENNVHRCTVQVGQRSQDEISSGTLLYILSSCYPLCRGCKKSLAGIWISWRFSFPLFNFIFSCSFLAEPSLLQALREPWAPWSASR